MHNDGEPPSAIANTRGRMKGENRRGDNPIPTCLLPLELISQTAICMNVTS